MYGIRPPRRRDRRAPKGSGKIDDQDAIDRIVAEVLDGHAGPVADYRAGKTKTFGFLVGQVMKATAGKADPARVNESVRRVLDARRSLNARGRSSPPRDRSAERVSEDVQPRRVCAARAVAAHRQGGVRLPDRPERRRQVDAAAPAAPAGDPHRRAARRRAARPRRSCRCARCRPTAARSASCSRTSSCCRTRPCSTTSRSCRACSAWRRRSSSGAPSRCSSGSACSTG